MSTEKQTAEEFFNTWCIEEKIIGNPLLIMQDSNVKEYGDLRAKEAIEEYKQSLLTQDVIDFIVNNTHNSNDSIKDERVAVLTYNDTKEACLMCIEQAKAEVVEEIKELLKAMRLCSIASIHTEAFQEKVKLINKMYEKYGE